MNYGLIEVCGGCEGLFEGDWWEGDWEWWIEGGVEIVWAGFSN
jgi:hypothetical protein